MERIPLTHEEAQDKVSEIDERYKNLARAIGHLDWWLNSPGKDAMRQSPRDLVKILAGASDLELDQLARFTGTDKQELNDAAAADYVKTSPVDAEVVYKVKTTPNNDRYRKNFLRYLELRTKAKNFLDKESEDKVN